LLLSAFVAGKQTGTAKVPWCSGIMHAGLLFEPCSAT
jgi:hypothetical protein